MKFIQKIKNHFEKHTAEEEKVIETIEEIMDEREERGDDVLVDSEELLLLRNLFKLRDIRAGEIMIPRADIISISATATLADLRDIVIREKFTRLPVYDKSLDNVVGLVHVKDLLCQLFEHGRDTTVQEVMTHNVLFVPTSIRVLDLLREMQNKFTQIAIVISQELIYLKKLRGRFDRFCFRHRDKGIPNLMMYIALGSALVYIMSLIDKTNALYYFLCFDRAAILPITAV